MLCSISAGSKPSWSARTRIQPATSSARSRSPSARRSSSASSAGGPSGLAMMRITCSWKTTTPEVSATSGASLGGKDSRTAHPCRASRKGTIMSLCTGPGPEQRDVDHQVVERLRERTCRPAPAGPATRSGNSPSVCARWISSKVGSSRSGRVSSSITVSVGPADLGQRVGHGRLHPDPEHVELEQAQLAHVVLVELTHREAGETRLHRGAIEQGQVAEQHPARMQGDVAGQPVQGLHQVEQQVQPPLGETHRPQFRQVAQGAPGRRGPAGAGTPWRWRRSPTAAD